MTRGRGPDQRGADYWVRSGVKASVLHNMGAVFTVLPPGRNIIIKKHDKICNEQLRCYGKSSLS